MIYIPRRHSLKIIATVSTVSLAITASSCAHTQAASPADPAETVMKAIHDYGRGHQSAISPAPASAPQETDEHYAAAIAVPPGDEVKDSDYDSRLAIAKRWVAAYPGS